MVPSRMKIERILCPTDYSEFSERALARAIRLAAWFDASVTVVHVVPMPLWAISADAGVPYDVPPEALRAQRQEEAQTLERFVEPYRKADVPIHTRLLDGDASRLIQEAALELPADLVVLGTHGRSGFEHLLLGSVTEKVLRRATCPVLTVGGAEAQPLGPLFRRILCATDLTEASARTIDVALSLAEENMARVTLVHVLEGVTAQAGPPGYRTLPEIVRARRALFEDAEDRLHGSVPGVVRDFCSVSECVEEGTPWRVVLQVAKETGAELIVIGAHSRGALARAFFGSTVNHVVRQAHCPVLVVRDTLARSPARRESSVAAALALDAAGVSP